MATIPTPTPGRGRCGPSASGILPHEPAGGDDLSLRPLTRDELDELVEWAAAEGWNPGLADADAFWRTDPEGFAGYFGDGKLIGGGSIVSYDGRHGFLGRYIVCPDLRGRGIGRGLWADLCETLGARLEPGALDRDRRRLRDAGLLRHDRVPLLAPEANAGAVALADRHGMHEVFGCARMYMGEAPPIPWERVYGVTTFELG